MNKRKNSKLSSKLQYMTESKILDKVHDVVVTRNRYHEYAIRAMREATPEELENVSDYVKSISQETGIDFYKTIENKMKEPDVFHPDCDLIADVQKYHQCIECYRYEHCRGIWEKENRL